MIEERLAAIERTLDELAPIIRSLGYILVQRKVVNEKLGLNKSTLTNNRKIDKFEAIGSRRVFVQVKDISVVKQRKRRGTSR
jgi:hypothetical protein